MIDRYADVRNAIVRGVREWFSELCSQHSHEQFYVFAIMTDSDFTSPQPAANSWEYFRQVAHGHGVDEELSCFLKWNPGDWAYSRDKKRVVSCTWDLFGDEMPGNPALDASDEEWAPLLEFRAKRIGVTMEALKQLSDDGLFDRNGSPMTVFCTIADDFHAGWLERESARRINPANVFAAFEPEQAKAARHWYLADANKSGELAEVFYRMFGHC
jgi:hypothetical protein